MRDTELPEPISHRGRDDMTTEPILAPTHMEPAVDPTIATLRDWAKKEKRRIECAAPLDTWKHIAQRLRRD